MRFKSRVALVMSICMVLSSITSFAGSQGNAPVVKTQEIVKSNTIIKGSLDNIGIVNRYYSKTDDNITMTVNQGLHYKGDEKNKLKKHFYAISFSIKSSYKEWDQKYINVTLNFIDKKNVLARKEIVLPKYQYQNNGFINLNTYLSDIGPDSVQGTFDQVKYEIKVINETDIKKYIAEPKIEYINASDVSTISKKLEAGKQISFSVIEKPVPKGEKISDPLTIMLNDLNTVYFKNNGTTYDERVPMKLTKYEDSSFVFDPDMAIYNTGCRIAEESQYDFKIGVKGYTDNMILVARIFDKADQLTDVIVIQGLEKVVKVMPSSSKASIVSTKPNKDQLNLQWVGVIQHDSSMKKAQNVIQLIYEGKPLKMDVTAFAPYSYLALVPIEAYSKALGYKIEKNSKTKELAITWDNHTTIIDADHNKITRDGVVINLDGTPIEINKVLYIPAADLWDCFDHKVNIDSTAFSKKELIVVKGIGSEPYKVEMTPILENGVLYGETALTEKIPHTQQQMIRVELNNSESNKYTKLKVKCNLYVSEYSESNYADVIKLNVKLYSGGQLVKTVVYASQHFGMPSGLLIGKIDNVDKIQVEISKAADSEISGYSGKTNIVEVENQNLAQSFNQLGAKSFISTNNSTSASTIDAELYVLLNRYESTQNIVTKRFGVYSAGDVHGIKNIVYNTGSLVAFLDENNNVIQVVVIK